MKKFKNKGFTLVEIIIVVFILGLLAAIAIPNFIRNREETQKRCCIANLQKIEAALELYELEINTTPAAVSDLVPDYLIREVRCPMGTAGYTIVNGVPVCPNDPEEHQLPTFSS
ncbi:MAG: prepilin-type N-terminal cleavage/methylation domain-containing protein [Candidatus Omnitrophota bacterium]